MRNKQLNRRFVDILFLLLLTAIVTAWSAAQASERSDLDRSVEACLNEEGVRLLSDDRYICFNAPIFPEQFLKLNDFPPVERIILSSPGGNVATARIMSRILDERDEPVTIAGQCMSACAMIILPGLDRIHIHRSAHFAVHGIVMMTYDDWWGWRRGGEAPTRMDRMRAAFGYDFAYAMFSAKKQHMEDHLAGQNVDVRFITDINWQMQEDAAQLECRLDPTAYWGVLSAEYILQFLEDRISRAETFPGSPDDPNFELYADAIRKVGDQSFVFQSDLSAEACDPAD